MIITDPVWPLLGLIIALTAYVATVRRRMLDKTEGSCTREKKEQLISYAIKLMFADVPLVISGSLIAIHNVWTSVNQSPHQFFYYGGIGFFLLALVVLVFFHVAEWKISLKKRSEIGLGGSGRIKKNNHLAESEIKKKNSNVLFLIPFVFFVIAIAHI